MTAVDYLLSALVSIGTGLDRTATFQLMISRPIVAAPLTGWVLGHPMVGLQVGALVELLWLGRLPVGAAIPPDDTQVSVAATVLAVSMGGVLGLSGLPFAILCTLVALPLGKVGQWFERAARRWNGQLLHQAESDLNNGRLDRLERHHLLGLIHFALCSLGTWAIIVAIGSYLLFYLAPLLNPIIEGSADWLRLTFILVGTAVILGTINVSRSLSLFAASFATAFLMLWLV